MHEIPDNPDLTTRLASARSWQYDASDPGAYSGTIIEAEATLDLSSVRLLGWEKCLSRDKVDQFVSEIRRGDSFPPVPVVDFGDHFSLAYWAIHHRDSRGGWLPDGGHHRSRAHYVAGIPLRATLLGLPPGSEFEYNTGFAVRDIRDIPFDLN